MQVYGAQSDKGCGFGQCPARGFGIFSNLSLLPPKEMTLEQLGSAKNVKAHPSG